MNSNPQPPRKKFQRGMIALVACYGTMAFGITCYCVTRNDATPSHVPKVASDGNGSRDWGFASPMILGPDLYVVPTHNIAAGSIVQPKDLCTVKMPEATGLDSAYGDISAVVGRVAARTIPQGQPVLPSHLIDRKTSPAVFLE